MVWYPAGVGTTFTSSHLHLLIQSITFAATLVSLLVGIYHLIIYPLFLSPLSKIPAAAWHCRIVPFYSWYIKYTNVENRQVHKLHLRHGPVVLLGPKELSVNSAEGLRTIYNSDWPKTEWYFDRFSNFGVDNIFTTRDSKQHHERKKLLSQAYSKSTILAASAIPATTANVIFHHLFPILQQSADTQTPVDIHPLDYAYSTDSFTAYQLGAALGTNFVGDGEAREWLLHHFFAPRPHTVFWEVEFPKLTRRLLSLGIRLVPEWCSQSRIALEEYFLERYDQAARLCEHVDDVVGGDSQTRPLNWPTIFAIAKEKYGQFGPSSFMTDDAPPPSPISATAKSGEGKLKPEGTYHHRLQIASDMYDETVAAIETSGIALTFLHYELARHPGVQDSLRAELRSLLPLATLPKTSSPVKDADLREILSDRISLRELDNLPLLDAIIIETLRRYPPVGGPQARYTPSVPGGITLPGPGGYEGIPGGIRVQSYAWSLHRHEGVFPDAEKWDPYRWLRASPGQLVEMRRWFWAFGSGGRMCLGKNFAIISIKIVVMAMYLRFSTDLVGGDPTGTNKILEQDDGFSAGPTSNALWLQFHELAV